MDELQSIKSIKESLLNVQNSIKDIDLKKFSNENFGNESEYSYKGLIAGVVSLITDVSALGNNQEKFIKISTYNERNEINSLLNNIYNSLESPASLFQHVDNLKKILRPFNIRYTKERYLEFDKEITNILKRKLEITEAAKLIDTLKSNIGTIANQVSKTNEIAEEKLAEFNSSFKQIELKLSELDTKITTADSLVQDVEDIKEKIDSSNTEIQNSYTEVKTNEKVIDSFVQRVQTRENQIDLIESKTDEYQKKLDEYSAERTKILKDANDLIESAKTALNYKTAEGLSASFKTRYDEEVESKPEYWLYGAAVCLAATIGIGIWILIDSDTTLAFIIGRVTLMPLPISGAIFCATQYIKRYNIIQDYGYKLVLSKSLVGFSEQLKKNENNKSDEYISYIKKVLDEIHQDPLRKRDCIKEKDGVKKSNLTLDDATNALSKFEEIVTKLSKLKPD